MVTGDITQNTPVAYLNVNGGGELEPKFTYISTFPCSLHLLSLPDWLAL